MKRLIPLVVFLVCFNLTPAAFAACPTAPTGPHTFGVVTWYDYGPDAWCWTLNTNGTLTALSTGTSCAGDPAYRHGYGYSSYEYTFQVASSNVQNVWYLSTRINFIDNNANFYNYVRIKATVTHNGTPTTTTLYEHRGNSGNVTCDNEFLNFNAVANDTVRILVEAENWYMSGTTIETDLPHIENSNF